MIPDFYFPQDKMAYIPAVILFILIFFGAFIILRIFQAISQRELKKFMELEKNVNTNIHLSSKKE